MQSSSLGRSGEVWYPPAVPVAPPVRSGVPPWGRRAGMGPRGDANFPSSPLSESTSLLGGAGRIWEGGGGAGLTILHWKLWLSRPFPWSPLFVPSPVMGAGRIWDRGGAASHPVAPPVLPGVPIGWAPDGYGAAGGVADI